MRNRGMSLAEQWQFWFDHHLSHHGIDTFTAYLQSYSNTYGPIAQLANALKQLEGLPGLHSLSLGTRPDCLDIEKLDLLATQRDALGLSDLFLELGLQSAHNDTLVHINRGHSAESFAKATQQAADRGLNVVAHVMAGLPTPQGKESLSAFLATIEFLNSLPVQGVKFHNLYVCRGTRMEALYAAKQYTPLSREEYLDYLSEGLMALRPDIVIHRLNGNPSKGELLAPDWAANMRGLHNAVRTHLDAANVWQGKNNGAEEAPPRWFSPDYKQPQ